MTELAFSKDRKEITSANIKAMADRFNQVSYWVATEILKSPSPRARQKTLQKFIAIATVRGFAFFVNADC
jgi:hypothetical protein